ncbi:MAG: hypothetical protein ABI383_12035 [Acidobacteriaceae bacterium]
MRIQIQPMKVQPIRVRPILVSSALAFALALSACGKQSSPETSSAPAATPNPAATTANTTPPPPDASAPASANTPATAPATVTSTAPAATDSTPSLAARDNATAEAPAPAAVVVPAGASLRVHLDDPLSTKTAQVGQTFNATLSSPVARNGRVVIPTGTPVIGEVTQAAQAGRFKGGAMLSVKLTSMTLRGKRYSIATSAITQTSKARGKRTAIGTGGGAALGGIIGGIAGGGKGAVIGLASGAGAGAAGSAFTGNRDVVLPAETPLSFHTTRSITLR